MCGSAIPLVNSAASRPLDAPASVNASETASASRKVPPLPPSSSGTPRPSRPSFAAATCSSRGTAPASSQTCRCGATSLCTKARAVSRSASCSALQKPGVDRASSSGTSTYRDRTHSPSALACGSKRLDAATPSPSRPWSTTLTPPRFASACTSMSSAAASGTRRRTTSGVMVASSQRTRSGRAPCIDGPEAEVGIAPLVARARVRDPSERIRRDAPPGSPAEDVPPGCSYVRLGGDGGGPAGPAAAELRSSPDPEAPSARSLPRS